MTILDNIVAQKKIEVAAAKQAISRAELETGALFSRKPLSLSDFLLDETRSGIIAEYKRQSPSKGIINANATVSEVTQGYAAAGASALSVLTDSTFFGGHADDLLEARRLNTLPILRKDFIIDAYQLYEAKAWGADVVLLIAAILTPEQIADFGRQAKDMGLSVLLEVHNEAELQRSLCDMVDAVGVNNRNLSDFTVDIQTSFRLSAQIPDRFLKVSESAIDNPHVIVALREAGFRGFLIGENFMKTDKPGEAMKAFVGEVNARRGA